MRALAVDFDDVKWLFVLIEERFNWRHDDKIDPAELGASDALEPKNIKSDTKSGVGIVRIMSLFA